MRKFSRCELNEKALPLAVALTLILFIIPALSFAAGPYWIDWYTIDGGGGTSRGGQYVLTGTIGQPVVDLCSGGEYELLGGFWSRELYSITGAINQYHVHCSSGGDYKLPGGFQPREPLSLVEFNDFAKLAKHGLKAPVRRFPADR